MPKNSRENKSFRVELVKQMVALSTSGFGLVAALAWNNLIQEFVSVYVKRWFPNDAKIFSLALYAIIVTLLAVIITIQLSKLADKFSNE